MHSHCLPSAAPSKSTLLKTVSQSVNSFFTGTIIRYAIHRQPHKLERLYFYINNHHLHELKVKLNSIDSKMKLLQECCSRILNHIDQFYLMYFFAFEFF